MLTNHRTKYTSSSKIDKERGQYRQLAWQRNWITNMKNTEISFEVCYVSTTVTFATISDIIKLNKALKHIKSENLYIKFPSLNTGSPNIRTWPAQVSTIFPMEEEKMDNNIIVDNENQSCSLAWNSLKIKRVVRSTLATETLSMTKGCDTYFFTAQIVNYIFQRRIINNVVITDNKSLLDSIQSTNFISDRRYR